MRKLVFGLLAMFTLQLANAQQNNFWTSRDAGVVQITANRAAQRASFPANYKLFDLNMAAFRQEMMSVAGTARTKSATTITLPNADGGLETFELVEASNFEPALQDRFPDIRSFSGKGITDPSATVKLSISAQGMQSMVLRTNNREDEYIESYAADQPVYAVFKAQRKAGQMPWTCNTADRNLANALNQQVGQEFSIARSGGNLKTYRLALSCNGEYANFFGATSSAQEGLVLAAFNNTLTRCNGIFEKDLAMHLNLISNTTNVIYYNGGTDPYTTLGNWNVQLENALIANVGEANYDIGHMFGASGGGGNAGCIGCICVNKIGTANGKGSGITSPADGIPQGDNFDIDYVAHEIGHQIGANHTFSHSLEGTGVNKEVGSGITIMGYAGITGQDVAPHSIDVFHQASIQQIQNNLLAKTCGTTVSIAGNNTTPVVAPLTNYTIPRSTPFALTGNATDADGDALTYSWEQNDNSTTTLTASVASATKTTGPNWISFKPTTSPTRLFPRLATILAGAAVTGPLPGGDAGANIEALSSVARTLNFRLTVWDNAPYNSAVPEVGQTSFADMVLTVNGTAGPFGVSAPNTAVSWGAGTTQTVTWTVNSTNLAPINCANVKISLSTDGGQTFPTVLLESTPNDGSQAVVIPNTLSTTARIKIEAIGNIFFDISNTNFSITTPPLCGDPTGLTTGSITNSSAAISWTAVPNAISYAVEYKLNTAATWTVLNAAQAGTTASLTGLTGATVYNWRVRATCAAGAGNYVQAANFTTLVNCGNPTGLTTGSITNTSAAISWTAVANATNYRVEYKTNAAATWTLLAAAQAGTTASLTGLVQGTAYNWRVQATCPAGTGSFVQANFSTTSPSCASALDNATNNTTAGSAVIPFNTNVTGLINVGSDVDHYRFTITTGGTITITLTTLPANYNLRLVNTNGTTVLVTSANGGTTNETITRTMTPGTYYVRVYPTNTRTFNATACYTLRVALGTATRLAGVGEGVANAGSINSASDIVAGSFYGFPNPVQNVLNLNLSGFKGNSEVVVYNMNGKRMMSKQTANINTTLDFSRLPKGIYLVRIFNANGKSGNLKVIKN
ncbi:MAG: hypothetical protein RLZZ172_194 [Bacteroidota bacterium]|jgi:hypothetical protein